MRGSSLFAVVVLVASACAVGSEGQPDGLVDEPGDGGDAEGGDDGLATTSASNASSSASSSSGSGGAGGDPSTSSASSSSSSGTGGSGGGAPVSKVLFMFGGGTATVGQYTDVVQSTGWATPLLFQTNDPIGLSGVGAGAGIALIRESQTGNLQASFFYGMYWSNATPIGATGDAGGSSIVNDGLVAHIAYRQNGQHVYARYDSGLWSPVAEVMGDGTSSGPENASLALVSGDPVALFIGDDGELYDQTRVGGVWGSKQSHSLAGGIMSTQPAVVAPDLGPELVVVYIAANQTLAYQTRSAGTWSAPGAVPGASSAMAPSLAALDGGRVALAYRGSDGKGYSQLLDSGVWTSAVDITGQNGDVICPPQVSRGAVGADAELIWTDAIGAVYWTRLTTSGWTSFGLAGVASVPSCAAIALAQ